MFIELTDHLRCPEPHEEQYLVLLPGRMEGRRVVTGDLGCPACGRVVRVRDGVVEFDPAGAPSASSPALPPGLPTGLTAEALAAFLGLGGPGGFVALVGGPGTLLPDLMGTVPGVAFVLINPPAGTSDTLAGSVVRAARLPLKQGSMRGIVLGPDFADRPEWVSDAVRATLPGLRIVAEGGHPPDPLRVLGRTAQCWVAEKPAAGPSR